MLRWSLGLILLVLASPALAREEPPAPRIVFAALGDLPYSEPEYPILEKQLASLAGRVELAVHVGDIKPGVLPCVESIYAEVARILKTSPVPCFIIPGDNEWNDCFQPATAWALWTKHLARLDAHWTEDWQVARQPIRDENFACDRRGVRFVGINLVGGRQQDADEWRARLAQDLAWVQKALSEETDGLVAAVVFGHALPSAKHRAFFDAFLPAVEAFRKPVLYLHGDGHRWTWDPSFGPRNLLRVQVDQGGIAPPVLISVVGEGNDVAFRIDRRLDFGPPVAVQPSSTAHAHNDYVHPRPLLDALDHGFTSIEADVFLRNGELLVGHTWPDALRGRSLESLYLDPLWQRFRADEKIFRDGTALQLLIDFKTDAEPTWEALQEKLLPYRRMLTRVVKGEVRRGAVTIAISGNRPTRAILEATSCDALLDGRFGDPQRPDFDRQRFALISASWSDHFGRTAPNALSPEQHQELTRLVATAQEWKLPLRFWGTPNDASAWRALKAAGVAWLSADDFEKWKKLMSEMR